MKLTYEVTEKGYVIFRDGVAWIVQDGYIPFEAPTFKESAEMHIEAILKQPESPSAELMSNEELQDKVKQQEKAIAELSAIVSMSMM